VRNDLLRQRCLYAIASIYLIIALLALVSPDKLAAHMGFMLLNASGYSEFYAIYIGVWSANAALALIAARRIREALLGDLSAMFLLAQPAARLIAALFVAWPLGNTALIMLAEIIGGLLLLWIRPSS
jgi:Domain of unknown function (DUF4345)